MCLSHSQSICWYFIPSILIVCHLKPIFINVPTCFIISSIYSIDDIKSRAADLGAKFILTDEARAKRVMEAVKDLECVKEVFVIGQAEGCTSVYELLQDNGNGERT